MGRRDVVRASDTLLSEPYISEPHIAVQDGHHAYMFRA